MILLLKKSLASVAMRRQKAVIKNAAAIRSGGLKISRTARVKRLKTVPARSIKRRTLARPK